MTTLRQILAANSGLPDGSTIRQVVVDPSFGLDVFVGTGLTADTGETMSADLGIALSANLTDVELTATIAENLSANIEQDLN